MTIKNKLSIRKSIIINGAASGIFITFPTHFRKAANLKPKSLISYDLKHMVLRLTKENDLKHAGEHTARLNTLSSIFINSNKYPELDLLEINRTQHIDFVIKNDELILDLSEFLPDRTNSHHNQNYVSTAAQKEMQYDTFADYHSDRYHVTKVHGRR